MVTVLICYEVSQKRNISINRKRSIFIAESTSHQFIRSKIGRKMQSVPCLSCSNAGPKRQLACDAKKVPIITTSNITMNIPYLCTSVACELQRSPIPTMEKIIEKSVSQKKQQFQLLRASLARLRPAGLRLHMDCAVLCRHEKGSSSSGILPRSSRATVPEPEPGRARPNRPLIWYKQCKVAMMVLSLLPQIQELF